MHAYRKDSQILSGASRVCGYRVPAWMSLTFVYQTQNLVSPLTIGK